jgi:hypothetical protein
MNQDDKLFLSRLCKPLIHSPKERIQPAFSRIVITSPSRGHRGPYFNTDAYSAVSVVTHASADHSQCSQTAGSDQTAVTGNMISTFHCLAPLPPTPKNGLFFKSLTPVGSGQSYHFFLLSVAVTD